MAKTQQEKAAFVLFPYTATPEQVTKYAEVLKETRPTARLLLSVPRERDDLMEPSLLKKFTFFACGEEGDHLVSRAIPLLSDLVYRDVDIVYFVTSTLRYSAQNTLNFASKCESTQSGILLLGNPPVLNPESNPEIIEALKIPEIVKSLMVDIFTSYVACQTNPMIFGRFMNLNAGIFAFRTHHASAGNTLREMLSKIYYRDSNLLSLSIALSMGANLSVRTIFLDTINLDSFTGGLARRIEDCRFVLDKLNRQKYLPYTISELVVNIFCDPQFKMIFREDEKSRKWFKTEVLGLAQEDAGKDLNVIKGDPLRNLPPPDLKRK